MNAAKIAALPIIVSGPTLGLFGLFNDGIDTDNQALTTEQAQTIQVEPYSETIEDEASAENTDYGFWNRWNPIAPTVPTPLYPYPYPGLPIGAV
mgnify:CR=1 FL=1